MYVCARDYVREREHVSVRDEEKRGSEAEDQNEGYFVFLVLPQDWTQRREEVTMKDTMGMFEITTIIHRETHIRTHKSLTLSLLQSSDCC